MAGKGRRPSQLLIGLLLSAATVMGAWLGFDRAATAGTGFWQNAAGVLGGAVIGLVLGGVLVVLAPWIRTLLKLCHVLLWLLVTGAVLAIHDLARHLDGLAYRLMRHRARILPAAEAAEAPDTKVRASQDRRYDWPNDESRYDDGNRDGAYRRPTVDKRGPRRSRKPRNLTRLAWGAAIVTGAAVAYGASAKSWQEIAIAGVSGALVGQFFPLLVNVMISLLAALIRLSGEILLSLLLYFARMLPAPIQRIAAALEKVWGRFSYYLLQFFPDRLDGWLRKDRPFRP